MNINLKLVKSGFDSIREDYTAIVVANGKMSQEDLIAAVNKSEPHISKISAEQVLATQLAFIGAMLAEGNYVNMGGIGLAPTVEGSLLHADEEVTSDKLGIEVRVYDSEYLEAIKSLDVTTSIDEDSLAFNFTKVEDSATRGFGTVTPGVAFMTIGDKLSHGLEGERIEITDKLGETAVITDAKGDSNGMWLKATCPFGLAAGKGKIAVYSRGLKTPEGAVDHISRSITIREAGVPKIVSVVGTNSGQDGVMKKLTDGITINVAGCSLEGAEAQLILRDQNDGHKLADTKFGDPSGNAVFTVKSATEATFYLTSNTTSQPDGSWTTGNGGEVALQIKLADGTIIEYPIVIVA